MNQPDPAPEPRSIPRWSDRLHRFFAFLESGGGSFLEREPAAEIENAQSGATGEGS